MTWPEWLRWYATTFGLPGEQNAEMLANWSQMFTARGWSADEVAAACRQYFDALAAARFRDAQLAVIVRGVEQARFSADAERTRLLRAEDESTARCCDCGGVGVMCGLPHPDPGKRARRYSFACYCHCALGRWKAGQETEPKWRLLACDQYAALVPDWRDLIAAAKNARAAEARARGVTGHMDKLMGSILGKAGARPPVSA